MTPRRNNNDDDDADARGSSSQTAPSSFASIQEDDASSAEIGKTVARPTSVALLDLCNLPSYGHDDESSRDDRIASRLKILQRWMTRHPLETRELLLDPRHRDVQTGCMPLHWAAGTGFDDAVEAILLFLRDRGRTANVAAVDQPAHHPSTSRTPLHYAARNGHLSTCRLLVRTHRADCHPKCGRGSVTPLQLAVWQNRLEVVRFLVEEIDRDAVVHERNGFDCGLMHWIGLVPKKRWCGRSHKDDQDDDDDDDNDGSRVLPLARYLHSLGVSYRSTPENSNSQGHTPMHKAAWGGNLALLRYFRDEHGVYDTVRDRAGNYAADIAKMRGEAKVHRWLLEEGSGDRAESYRVLGLDLGVSLEEVKRRYRELARVHHPDRLGDGSCDNDNDNDGNNDLDAVDDGGEFIKIKEAYEHLTKENGIGKQKNPKFDELRLLQYHKRMSDKRMSDQLDRGTHNNDTDADADNQNGSTTIDILDERGNDDLFVAKLIAVLSDYGTAGFPVALIARRWNQIWPDRPFPAPDEYVVERTVKIRGKDTVIRKKVKLLKWLKWRCRGTNVRFRNKDGVVVAFGDGASPGS
ncbi:hypothetical protein ACHAXS_000957 [Conticribra weissflogii]